MNQILENKEAGKLSLSMELKSALEELPKVREFCFSISDNFLSTECELDHEERDALFSGIQLATTESVTNVIRHGYELENDRPIWCYASSEDGLLYIDIIHLGKSFEPESVPEIDQPLEGGMGLFLIQQCTESVSYSPLPDGRPRIRLGFRLKP